MKTYLFDMDGTLVDSEYVWDVAFGRILEKYNIQIDMQKVRPVAMTMSLTEVANIFSANYPIPLSGEQLEKAIVDIVEDLYRYEVQPIQGMPDYIHQCHQQGIQLVVVTSNRQDLTEMVLERFGVLSGCDKLYCSSNNGLVKRDPNTYVHILNELGVRAEDTLLFEDAYYAIASAAQSGIPAIGIASPMNQKDFIEHQVRTIQDYTELL